MRQAWLSARAGAELSEGVVSGPVCSVSDPACEDLWP